MDRSRFMAKDAAATFTARQRAYLAKLARHIRSVLASLEAGNYSCEVLIGHRERPDGRIFRLKLVGTWVNKPSRSMKAPGHNDDDEPRDTIE